MKLLITDMSENEHDLDKVVLGFAADIHMLNTRLQRVEKELGFEYEQASPDKEITAEITEVVEGEIVDEVKNNG